MLDHNTFENIYFAKFIGLHILIQMWKLPIYDIKITQNGFKVFTYQINKVSLELYKTYVNKYQSHFYI